MAQKDEMPEWAKILLYIGLPVSALAIVGYIVYGWLTSGVNAYKDMWTQQYNALVNKMAEYQKSNPEGFTPAQQQNIAEEEKVLQMTSQGLANSVGGLYNTLVWMTTIIVGGLVAVGIGTAIVNKWLNKTKGQWNTAHGASYIAIMSMADDLALRGFPLQATNLVASAQTMYQTLDLPYMQSTIQQLTDSLAYLTGVQLLVAQQMIATLNLEIAYIPFWLATPLPLP